MPSMKLPIRRNEGFKLFGGAVVTLVTVGSIVVLTAGSLPNVLEGNPSGRPALFSDHPLVLLIQLAMAAAYGAASDGLLRAARSTGDPLLKWVAAGAASSAFARANYALCPSLYTEFIYTGRCASAGLLPVDPGRASQEVRGYWRRLEADIVERNQLVVELERLALDDSFRD